MREGDPGGGQLAVFGVDVVDPDRERDPGAGGDLALIEKDREVGVVAHRGGPALGDLEFDFELEMAPVPVARFLPITDRQRQVIRRTIAFLPRSLCGSPEDNRRGGRGGSLDYRARPVCG